MNTNIKDTESDHGKIMSDHDKIIYNALMSIFDNSNMTDYDYEEQLAKLGIEDFEVEN